MADARDKQLLHQIRKTLKAEHLTEVGEACLAALRAVDGDGRGVLRVADFNEGLRSLTEEERHLLRAHIPRDPFGRIKYATFTQVLSLSLTLPL